MKVKCIVSRRIADDDYQLGQEYNVTKERVEKYYAVGGLPAPKTGSNGNKD